MNANPILLQKKYSRIVEDFAAISDITLDEALRLFYRSATYRLINEGISDMHCMSDRYLAEAIAEEYKN